VRPNSPPRRPTPVGGKPRNGPTAGLAARSRPSRCRRPDLEALEGRQLLSTIQSGPHDEAPPADSLFVGDASDNTVKRFDATTGAYQGTLVAPGSGGLHDPRGLIFGQGHDLLVVSQNVNLPLNGEVLRYDGETGAFDNKVVATTTPHAPLAPRGMVRGPMHTVFVADLGDLGVPGGAPGRLAQFDERTGAWKRDLTPTGFTGEFNPRGVVIGPDGALYLSVRNLAATGGHILKFDTHSGAFLGDFVDSNPTNDLNRPEGIAFGPDGNLYVTSFRTDAADTDKVIEFSGTTGAYLGKIDLDRVGQARAYGQALLFGPGGKLFVPITGGDDPGGVRRYDVGTKTFDVFVPPSGLGGALGQPWYLTFGQTDASTLSYQDESDSGSSGGEHHGAYGQAREGSATPAATLDYLIAPVVDQALTEGDLFRPRRRSDR
jgi:hypothetical protein